MSTESTASTDAYRSGKELSMEVLLLRADDVARLLQLSRSQVYKMIKSGKIPSIHIGRSVRISRKGLAAWVSEQTGESSLTDFTASPDVDTDAEENVADLLHQAGFDRLGSHFSLKKAEPVLRRVAKLVAKRTPLERHLVREECIRRLTRAKVRTPARAVDMALQTAS